MVEINFSFFIMKSKTKYAKASVMLLVGTKAEYVLAKVVIKTRFIFENSPY